LNLLNTIMIIFNNKMDEEQEINGTCYECGIEGKFLGEEGDEWLCCECSSLSVEDDEDQQ
jgi:hypothetical protein